MNAKISWATKTVAPTDERMLMLGKEFPQHQHQPWTIPAGKYTVEATVRDTVGKVEVALKKEFVVP